MHTCLVTLDFPPFHSSRLSSRAVAGQLRAILET